MKTRQFAVGLIAAVLAVTGHGEESTPDQRLDQLEQEIRILKRQRELDQEAAAAKAKPPVLQVDEKGFGFKSADGNFALKLKGVVQIDTRWFLDDDAKNGTDGFLVRRARPILGGTLYKDFDFRLMPDFAGSSVTLFDAYAEWKHWPWLKLRVGKFKTPLGLEQLQEDVNTLFTERSLVTDLGPNRDVGVQLSGEIAEGVLSYAAAVFNGVPDGANGDLDNGDSKDFAGRVFVQPFLKIDIEPLQGLGLGVAGTIGYQDGSLAGPNVPSFKTPGQNTFFKYLTSAVLSNQVIANGQRVRVSPQAYYYWGPFGLISEYAYSEQEIEKGLASDHLRNTAWQVSGSIVLTGERASFKGVTPLTPFDPKSGGWGAFELTGRYSTLRLDPDAFPVFANLTTSAQEARAWAVGLNWYLNKNVKLVATYEQTTFDGGGGGTVTVPKDRETERVFFTRAQLTF